MEAAAARPCVVVAEGQSCFPKECDTGCPAPASGESAEEMDTAAFPLTKGCKYP